MLDIEERGRVVVVHMRQVPANVLSTETLQRLTAAVEFIEGSRALVLTGYRSTFAVDAWPHGGFDDTSDARDLLLAQRRALQALGEHPGTVVAAINGDALDAGFALAAAADIRLMTRGMIGITRGETLASDTREVVARVAGPLADSMLLNGGTFTANEAAAIGLIDGTSTPCSLLDEAITTAADHEGILSSGQGA